MESESDPLTRRVVDVFEKEPLKGNSEVHLHTPTKFGDDRSKDLGGDREQTDRQTNRQTDKRCSIYSMILCKCFFVQHSNFCVIKNSHVWPVEKDQITQAKLGLLSLLLLCNFMNGTKKNKN